MRCSKRSLANNPLPTLRVPAARLLLLALLALGCIAGSTAATERGLAQQPAPELRPARGDRFIGFDRNEYPGDGLLPALRRSFSFTGYWLNNPPGASKDSWMGKRSLLVREGFGFLVLWNGRLDADLKKEERRGEEPAALGRLDGAAAVAAARREGFPAGAILFLDQEEGGRLLPEQLEYLSAWTHAVEESGFRAGVYCSGIQAPDGAGTISTAEFLRGPLPPRPGAPSAEHSVPSSVALWIFNDQCPPSPGCQADPQIRAHLEIPFRGATVWQYARSPRAVAARECRQGYAADGDCYAPLTPHGAGSFVDLDLATSADPSAGR